MCDDGDYIHLQIFLKRVDKGKAKSESQNVAEFVRVILSVERSIRISPHSECGTLMREVPINITHEYSISIENFGQDYE